MKLIIGMVAMPTIDASQVRYKATTSDPVPICSVALKDDTSSISITAPAELLILDEHLIPNPTSNLLLNPALNGSANWTTTGTNGGLLSFGVNQATMTFSNSPVANGLANQTTTPSVIVPGQSSMLSLSVQATSPVNIQSIVQFQWLDAGKNSISTVSDIRSAPTSLTRIAISAVAPAGAAYIQVQFGGQPTNATNSGTITFTQIQLEPMWWPTEISYPTPWCGPSQTNCVQLPQLYYIRQYRKFGGIVNHAIARDYHGNARTWYIDASGYAWLFSLTFTANSYTNTYDSTILASLIASSFYSSITGRNFFDTSGVVQGALISVIQSNWDDLRTLTDAMAAQAGFYWTVDPYWKFLYQPPGYTQMSIALIADNSVNPDMVTTFPVYNWQAEMDFTQPGSSVLVLGGQCSTTITSALTNGTQYNSLSVAALPAPIISLTQMTIGGNQIFTVTANAAAGATTLSIQNQSNNANFTAQANYGVGTSITTNQYVANVIDPANSNTYNQQVLPNYTLISSIFQRKVIDGTLQSGADVTARGLAELLQYDAVRFVYHGITNVELLVGQSIQVTSNTDGLNAQTLLVQQVVATWIGMNEQLQDVWEYQVDLGATNRAATSILSHIFRQTTKGTAAPAITNTALAVFERFTVTDTAPYPATPTPGTYGFGIYGNGNYL